jgi:hypothetical protein
VQGGGGPQTVVSTGDAGQQFFGQTLFPIEGTRPARPTKRPVFRPNEPCENQAVPDLSATLGMGEASASAKADPTPANRKREARVKRSFKRFVRGLRKDASR